MQEGVGAKFRDHTARDDVQIVEVTEETRENARVTVG